MLTKHLLMLIYLNNNVWSWQNSRLFLTFLDLKKKKQYKFKTIMIFRSTVRVHLSRKWELNHYKLLELFSCDLKTWSQGEQDVIMGEDTHHQAWWIVLSPWTPLGRRKQRIWRQVQSSDLHMHAMAHVHACVHVCVRACIKVKKRYCNRFGGCVVCLC